MTSWYSFQSTIIGGSMTGWSVRHEADVRQSAFGPVIVLEDPELPLLVHHLQARGMATARK